MGVNATIFAGVVAGILVVLFAAEIKAWLPWLTERALRRALENLPDDIRERYEEEWRAAINDTPGLLGKLLFTLGLNRAALGLRRVYRLASRDPFTIRAFDIVLVGVLLLMLAPLSVLIMLSIKLTGGTVFVWNKGVGRRGNHFRYLKFNTMVPDADRIPNDHLDRHPELREKWERDHEIEDDPRFTLIGAWLRATSIDHLPAIIIILLRGEMTLIGGLRPFGQALLRRFKTYVMHVIKAARDFLTGGH